MNTINAMMAHGTVKTAAVFDHEHRGVKIYRAEVETPRLSDYKDIVPVTFKEELAGSFAKVGDKVTFLGQVRTFTTWDETARKQRMKVLCHAYAVNDEAIQSAQDDELQEIMGENDNNCVRLVGTICKTPILRKTPAGKIISDVLVAVNTTSRRSDYIPVIAWGIEAQRVCKFDVGERIAIIGRFQSREYIKRLDGVETTRTAYEISAREISRVSESEFADIRDRSRVIKDSRISPVEMAESLGMTETSAKLSEAIEKDASDSAEAPLTTEVEEQTMPETGDTPVSAGEAQDTKD